MKERLIDSCCGIKRCESSRQVSRRSAIYTLHFTFYIKYTCFIKDTALFLPFARYRDGASRFSSRVTARGSTSRHELLASPRNGPIIDNQCSSRLCRVRRAHSALGNRFLIAAQFAGFTTRSHASAKTAAALVDHDDPLERELNIFTYMSIFSISSSRNRDSRR